MSGINEDNESEFVAGLIVRGLLQASRAEIDRLTASEIFAQFAQFNKADILSLEARKILAVGGAIEIGEDGIMMIPPGHPQRSMHLLFGIRTTCHQLQWRNMACLIMASASPGQH